MGNDSLEIGSCVSIKNWPTLNLIVGISDDRVRIYWRSKSGKTEGVQNVMGASVVEVLDENSSLVENFENFVGVLEIGRDEMAEEDSGE